MLSLIATFPRNPIDLADPNKSAGGGSGGDAARDAGPSDFDNLVAQAGQASTSVEGSSEAEASTGQTSPTPLPPTIAGQANAFAALLTRAAGAPSSQAPVAVEPGAMPVGTTSQGGVAIPVSASPPSTIVALASAAAGARFAPAVSNPTGAATAATQSASSPSPVAGAALSDPDAPSPSSTLAPSTAVAPTPDVGNGPQGPLVTADASLVTAEATATPTPTPTSAPAPVAISTTALASGAAQPSKLSPSDGSVVAGSPSLGARTNVKPGRRESQPVDGSSTRQQTTPQPDAILASLLGLAPAPTSTTPAETSGGDTPKGASTQIASLPPPPDSLATTDHSIANRIGTSTDPADGTDTSFTRFPSGLAPSAASLDAKVATTAEDNARVLVSVISQQTHFPAVAGLSVTDQLAKPIAAVAASVPDLGTAASTAPAPLRTLDVSLSPGDLGNVTINLRLVGGTLHLGVAADQAGTADMIERDKTTLASALHASGYTVADLTVVHSASANSGAHSQGSNDNGTQNGRSFGGSTGDGDAAGTSGGRQDDRQAGSARAPRAANSNGTSAGASRLVSDDVYL